MVAAAAEYYLRLANMNRPEFQHEKQMIGRESRSLVEAKLASMGMGAKKAFGLHQHFVDPGNSWG